MPSPDLRPATIVQNICIGLGFLGLAAGARIVLELFKYQDAWRNEGVPLLGCAFIALGLTAIFGGFAFINSRKK